MQMASGFYLVGIGASAGGLEALEQFFKALKPVDNMTFVVIQHLSPDYKSYMPELISKYTSVKVCLIQDQMELEYGCIYLNPPKYNVVIKNGRFQLLDQNPTQRINQSIDTFFESLAEYKREKSIGIIMSGTGSDGTRGCRAIKEAGGIVILQEKSSARFTGMINNVISSNMYDYILHPRNMPEALLKYVSSSEAASKSDVMKTGLYPGDYEAADLPEPLFVESPEPLFIEAGDSTDMTSPIMEPFETGQASESSEAPEMVELYAAILEECLPTSVIVDEKGDLVQVCGNAAKYLRVPKGRVYYNILKMVPQELSHILGPALEKVRATQTPVTFTNLNYMLDGENNTINLKINPIAVKNRVTLVVITFEELKHGTGSEEVAVDLNLVNRLQERIFEQEQEFRRAKEYLQKSLNDMKAANEELILANKALLNTNERLLVDNQELVEANTQYQLKLQELNQLAFGSETGDSSKTSSSFEKIFRFLPFAAMIVSNNTIKSINDEGMTLLQLKSLQQIKGCPLSNYFNLDEEMLRDRFNSYISDQTSDILPMEEKLIRTDGTVVHLEITAIPVQYEAEDSLLLIMKDINFKKLSEQLKEDFMKSKKQLEEARLRDSMKNDFFSNLSHELRTPLNVIMSTLQLMESIMKKDNSAQPAVNTKKYMDIMKQNCFRQLRLINNLIDITKIDAGFFEVEMHNYNIVSIVENITLSVSEYVKTKSIELLFDTEVEEKIIACNPDSIERIILNLLSNAIKFTNEGGNITVTIYDRDEWVAISIKDSGIGIPREKLNIIFERFRQAEKSLTRGQGSGIGLSLVKSLVELHRGKIEVLSQPGKGSEFIVMLPAVKIDEEEVPVKDENGKQQNHVEKIHIEFSDIYNLN